MSQPSPPETGNSFNALRRHTIGASGQAVRFAVGGGARRTSLNAWGSTQFCESFQPSGEELDAQWEHTLGKYGGLPSNDAREIASIFSNAELPAPSKDSLVYMTHEFMISLGVTAPGDRARVMLALDRMPPPQTQTTGEEERGLASSKNKNSSALPRHVLSFSDDTDQVRVFTRRSNTGSCTWYDLVGKDPMPPEGGGTSEYLNQLSLLQSHFARKMASAAAAASNGRKRSIAPIMVIDSRAGFSPQEIPVLSAGASREGSRDASGPEEKRNSVDTSSEIWDILSMKTPLPHMITDSQRRNRVSFILRVCTTSADLQDASFSALTNKWVVFADEDMGLVATVHRVDSIALATMRERDVTDGSDFSFGALICQIIVAFLQEFEVALDQSGDSLDDAESALLDYSKHDHLIELLYHLDRRASVYERLIDLNKQLVNELGNHFGLSRDLAHLDPQWTRLRDKTQNLGDRSQNLLSLLLSLSGHRTNTLMSLLTKFSLVFIPLTFITGVYGMNFDNMPELNYENSYYVCASLMIAFLIFGFIAASRL